MTQGDPFMTYEDAEIRMVRHDFDAISRIELPSGYAFRAYRAGDDAIWTEIQRASDPFNIIGDDLFEQQYGSARDELPHRMWFVVGAEGEAVATISSWWEHGPDQPDDRGRIHWVAVRPDHQRRGISKPMMTKALTEMARYHDRAMLDTSSGRPWAVKVYLDFGFHPEPADLADPTRLQAWHNVQNILDHPSLRTLPLNNESDNETDITGGDG